VDVLIDKRELLEKARQRNLSLQMIEKDYVLGWLLFCVSRIPGLVFNGEIESFASKLKQEAPMSLSRNFFDLRVMSFLKRFS
jgi:hypothetical protein